MRLVWREFRDRMYIVVRDAGYTDLQPMHALLFRYPTMNGVRPGQLADQLGLSKQSVNDLLRQLEAKGYLELRRDPSDGRARLVTLTDRGEELRRTMYAAAQQVSDDCAQVIGAERLKSLWEALFDLNAELSRQPTADRGNNPG